MIKIKIMGHEYDLEMVKGFVNDLRINPDSNLGRINHVMKVIQIDPEVKGFFEIILHECVHAIDYKLNLGMNEDTVQRFSEALYLLLKDNEWFIGDMEDVMLERYACNQLSEQIDKSNTSVSDLSDTIKRLKGEYERA